MGTRMKSELSLLLGHICV